jgi:RecA/RadA recombinase
MKLPFISHRRNLKEENARLFCKNIMMLIELETIAEDPTGDKAKQIIAKYRLRIERRKEIEQASQN